MIDEDTSAKFRIKPGEDCLEQADFDYWPAWSEYYDFEEVDLIESWGIARDWVLGKFCEYDKGGSHSHYTILDLDKLPFDNMRIFLLADFYTPDGYKLSGYIMNKADLCITIFSRDCDYTFSTHPLLLDQSRASERAILESHSLSRLFPLRYETRFKDGDGHGISGEYKLDA